jgi:hypothetical protein
VKGLVNVVALQLHTIKEISQSLLSIVCVFATKLFFWLMDTMLLVVVVKFGGGRIIKGGSFAATHNRREIIIIIFYCACNCTIDKKSVP